MFMIKVENLYHDYGGKGNYSVSDISFTIEEGKIFGFLGPSGAGKSTVQNIMTGLLKLQKGSIMYDKLSVTHMTSEFFNKVGVSFEQPNVYLNLTGYENLKYFAGLFSAPTIDPMKVLDRVGLRDSANKRAGEYSKGMKQRLNVARALINNPEILFLDEPTGGLDPSTAARIKDLILEQKQRGVTIFLTTHNMYLADALCDEVAFLEGGRIAAMDSPANLKLKYGEQAVVVEYLEGNATTKKLFQLDEAGKKSFANFVINQKPITIHSQEATLEDIFIRITGRGLTA
jgi:fluoroquinolone transport system ATP-binding protein